MTAIHDQAMHYIYQQVLERLLNHMSQAQRAALQLLIQRLLVAAGGAEYIGTFRLLVLHGSDRRSIRLLAMLRAAQLSIALRGPVTFQLRVLVVSLPAAGEPLRSCHERNFSALFLQDDPRVQLQMMEGRGVVPFSSVGVSQPPASTVAKDAMLVFGHLIDARPEALLGSRLHLEVAMAVGAALQSQASADVLVTAIAARQRRRFLAWARRSLLLAGERGVHETHHCLGALTQALIRLGNAAQAPTAAHAVPEPQATTEAASVRVMPMDDFLEQLLEGQKLDVMLGSIDETARDAWPFGAFVDPVALAQLHELRARSQEPQPGRPALRLACPAAEGKRRDSQSLQVGKAYGIDHGQLTCLCFNPFARQGKNLERFLQCRHTDMLVALPYLHRALQGKPCPEAVKAWLVNISGLQLGQLKWIYEGRLPLSAWRVLSNLARRDIHLRLLPRRLPNRPRSPAEIT
ncbi:hypothetical protein [Pseudomonas parafulva]|uniref:hypothetical protein n=1 Tax=Pseudomonas parafulva TaxID=157782 RepID=UPI0004066616|nr:hypothetical protein [Pseudomonas parafulva]